VEETTMKKQDRVLPLGKNYGVERTAAGETMTLWWYDLGAALRYAGAVYDPDLYTRLRIVTDEGVVMLDTEQQAAVIEATDVQ
jgi:hypothetical protein